MWLCRKVCNVAMRCDARGPLRCGERCNARTCVEPKPWFAMHDLWFGSGNLKHNNVRCGETDHATAFWLGMAPLQCSIDAATTL